MAKQKNRYIDLDFSIPDSLKASVIPYDGSNSIKAKIDAHDAAVAPHTGVVKTSGDQSVGGIKTFTQFPFTPGSPPSVDYEIANKKYVDDNTGGNINHGDLQGLSNNDHPQYPLVSGSISQLSNHDHDQLDGLGDDDHGQYLTVARHDALGHSPVASSILHNGLSGIGDDDHHTKIHAMNGVDHTGDIAYQQLDSLVDLSGGGSSSMISAATHTHNGGDGSSKITHLNLLSIGENDHHSKFTDTEHDARDHTAVAGTIGLGELGSKAHSELTGVSADQHHAQSHTLQSHSGDLAYTQLDSIVDTSGAGGSAQISRADHVHTGSDGSTQTGHGSLTGVSANQHHAQSHTLQSHSGDLAYTQLDSIVDTSGTGASNLISRANHVHTSADGSTKVTHSNLASIGASDHHTKFTAAEARSAAVSDAAYGSGWNGVTTIAPSKNAVYDKIQAIGGGTIPVPLHAGSIAVSSTAAAFLWDFSASLPAGVRWVWIQASMNGVVAAGNYFGAWFNPTTASPSYTTPGSYNVLIPRYAVAGVEDHGNGWILLDSSQRTYIKPWGTIATNLNIVLKGYMPV